MSKTSCNSNVRFGQLVHQQQAGTPDTLLTASLRALEAWRRRRRSPRPVTGRLIVSPVRGTKVAPEKKRPRQAKWGGYTTHGWTLPLSQRSLGTRDRASDWLAHRLVPAPFKNSVRHQTKVGKFLRTPISPAPCSMASAILGIARLNLSKAATSAVRPGNGLPLREPCRKSRTIMRTRWGSS